MSIPKWLIKPGLYFTIPFWGGKILFGFVREVKDGRVIFSKSPRSKNIWWTDFETVWKSGNVSAPEPALMREPQGKQ